MSSAALFNENQIQTAPVQTWKGEMHGGSGPAGAAWRGEAR